jgi:hypothetical protein
LIGGGGSLRATGPENFSGEDKGVAATETGAFFSDDADPPEKRTTAKVVTAPATKGQSTTHKVLGADFRGGRTGAGIDEEWPRAADGQEV